MRRVGAGPSQRSNMDRPTPPSGQRSIADMTLQLAEASRGRHGTHAKPALGWRKMSATSRSPGRWTKRPARLAGHLSRRSSGPSSHLADRANRDTCVERAVRVELLVSESRTTPLYRRGQALDDPDIGLLLHADGWAKAVPQRMDHQTRLGNASALPLPCERAGEGGAPLMLLAPR